MSAAGRAAERVRLKPDPKEEIRLKPDPKEEIRLKPDSTYEGLVNFAPVPRCWVCDGTALRRYYRSRMDFSEYAQQDPELHEYTGEHVWFVRCAACGFGQPEVLPTLPRYFDRMYDQHWSQEWVESEFASTYKDLIFQRILDALAARVPAGRRRLLDVGAHAGRFMHLAQARGWTVSGIELNPRTATYAEARTGAKVHRENAHALGLDASHRYDAVVLTDVLEHIPEPTRLLGALLTLLEPGGVVAVKVPNGAAQWTKERWLARITSHQMSLAENLVHVNQFTPGSLALALGRAGFSECHVETAAPELSPSDGLRATVSRSVRRALFAAASLPGSLQTPLALHLQAYARRGAR
jgi:2-polyprenyl-3-methyl-5-hydroxy-6-metoxy-1,4-benzoquinol methylase